MLPILLDIRPLLAKLEREERERLARLAELEGQIRDFEAVEQPAHRNWLRVELGPSYSLFDELRAELRKKQHMLEQLNALVSQFGFSEREALHIILHGLPDLEEPARKKGPNWNEEEMEARRQAKRERKRAERRESRKARKPGDDQKSAPAEPLQKKVISVYRTLARRLHPDARNAKPRVDPQRAQALWLEVQAAYEASDLSRLVSIAAWLGETGERATEPAVFSLSERYERLKTLDRSIRQQVRRLQSFAKDPAWGFRVRPVKERKRELRRAERQIDEELASAQATLEAYETIFESIGPAKPPRKANLERFKRSLRG